MARNIEQIMDLFLHEPFWEISSLKAPDERALKTFAETYHLPVDYAKILATTDGFVLFHAGDYSIHRMDEILQFRKLYNPGLLESALIIGEFMENSLLINQNESHTSGYLYAGPSCLMTDYVRVGTITDFFNGLIQTKGEIPCWETENRELFDFSIDHLSQNPGILEVPARGRTIVSTRPYYPTEEEIKVNGGKEAVVITYSNGTEEVLFSRPEENPEPWLS